MNAIRQRIISHKESLREFELIDRNKDDRACFLEISLFVNSRRELWSMLGVNLNLEDEVCRSIATRVVMELASGLQGENAMKATLTSKQFHRFRKNYLLDPEGSQEFFHRCVFAAFDTDGNSYLDKDELDGFLDTYYKAGSIFEGDVRLPEKAELKRRIMEKFDGKNEGRLSFEKIRGVISGAAMHDVLKT